jgi:hypothetical protein
MFSTSYYSIQYFFSNFESNIKVCIIMSSKFKRRLSYEGQSHWKRITHQRRRARIWHGAGMAHSLPEREIREEKGG